MIFIKSVIVLAGAFAFSSLFSGELSKEQELSLRDKAPEILEAEVPEVLEEEVQSAGPKKRRVAAPPVSLMQEQYLASNDKVCLDYRGNEFNPYHLIEGLCEQYLTAYGEYFIWKDIFLSERDIREINRIISREYKTSSSIFMSPFFLQRLPNNEEEILRQLEFSLFWTLEQMQSYDFSSLFSFLSEKDLFLRDSCSQFLELRDDQEELERIILLEWQFEPVKRQVDREINFTNDDLIRDVNTFLEGNKAFANLPHDLKSMVIINTFDLHMDRINLHGDNIDEEIKSFNEIFDVAFPDTPAEEIYNTVSQVMDDIANDIFEDIDEVIQLAQNGVSHADIALHMGWEPIEEYSVTVYTDQGNEFEEEEKVSYAENHGLVNTPEGDCEHWVFREELDDFKKMMDFIGNYNTINQQLTASIIWLNIKQQVLNPQGDTVKIKFPEPQVDTHYPP